MYGLPYKLVKAITELYDGTTAEIQTSDGSSDTFSTSSGVLQGDTLAPYLFVIMLDYVLRKCLDPADGFEVTPRRSSRYPAERLAALAYADDIALLAHSPEAAQRALSRLVHFAAKVGLQVNASKTEVMHLGTDVRPTLTLPGGEVIRTCEEFKYLGVTTSVHDTHRIYQERRQLSWAAARALQPIFQSGARDSLKIRLLQAAVEPIFLYGLEALPMPPSLEEKLDASHRQLQRCALGIRFPRRITTEDLLLRTKLSALKRTVRQRRLRVAGHVLRAHTRQPSPLSTVLLHRSTARLRHGHGNTVTWPQATRRGLFNHKLRYARATIKAGVPAAC